MKTKSWCIRFPFIFGVDSFIKQKKKNYKGSLSFYFVAFTRFFVFEDTIVSDVAIDVAKYAFPSKAMQGPPCLESRTLTNDNECHMM